MIVSIRDTVLILSYNLTAVHGNNIRFGIKFEKGMSEKYCFFFFGSIVIELIVLEIYKNLLFIVIKMPRH